MNDTSGFLQDHLQKTHPNPACEHCGKLFDSANSLDLHTLNDCDKITVSCALKDFGCSHPVGDIRSLR
jgi:hypothetical protein